MSRLSLTMSRLGLLALVVVAIGSVNVSASADASSSLPMIEAGYSGGGRGGFWETWIYSDGLVRVEFQRADDDEVNVSKSRLSIDEVQRLKNIVHSVNFFQINTHANGMSHSPAASIAVRLDGQERRVSVIPYPRKFVGDLERFERLWRAINYLVPPPNVDSKYKPLQ